jgi:hypothetical protein
MLVDRKGILVLFMFWLFLAFPVFAQQSPSWQGANWQGSHGQQPPAPASSQEPRAVMPQPSLPPPIQNEGEGHPQVMEMPTAQEPAVLAPQSVPSVPQPPATRAMNVPAKPAYLGIAGQTIQACRYPAGVRVTRVIEGSPAHQAGLKGEATLTWKQAMTGVLTMTPFAPLVLPFLSESEHGGSGDLILAVDGKRIHTREELEQEMGRFRPGDTIYFSVLRERSGLQQIPVQLVEYPDTAPDAATAMAR